jgi:AcrR family transcriptional regulator
VTIREADGRHTIPGAARAQKPQVRTAERRTAILEAATTVFGTRGYNSGSLVEIAERVGMTHAGILHHFGSKEQLLLAVLAHRDDADIEALDDHRSPVGPAFLDHLVHTARENTARSGIVQTYAVLAAESVTGNHPAREFFRSRFSGLRAKVACDLALTVGVDESDPRVIAAASAIIAVMDGLQVQWLLDSDHVEMPETVQLVIDAIVENLRR